MLAASALIAAACLSAGSAAAAEAIPVLVQTAMVQDVPVYATGLGTVTALATALVRPRVDGLLEGVAFTEGQQVKAGDLLATIDPRPYLAVLDEAKAKRAQDVATLANGQVNLSRTSALTRQGFATQQASGDQGASVQSGQALVAADDAAIEAAALNVSFTHVTSPIAGRVGLRQINPGNIVHAADSQGIVTVTQIAPIGVVFTLPEDGLGPLLAGGTDAALPVDVVDTAGSMVLDHGTLLAADNSANTTTGTISLKAVFGNGKRLLWPGAFVQARILLRTLPHVVTVPAAAVQRGPDGLYVFVIDRGGVASQRPVSEYQEQDGTAAISKGLAAGDRVVVDGQSRVSNGAHVSATAASG